MEYVTPIKKTDTKGKRGDHRFLKFMLKASLLISGVVMATLYVADWGTKHQIIGQPVVAQELRLQLPIRIEPVKPQIIISPIVERVAEDDFTPIEQKIIDKWGYKDGFMAMAIFECESGLEQYAVSGTGDLGIAQIHWRTWKDYAEDKFGWNAGDMFDVDNNLQMAYIVWDRGDGVEGNGEGTWDAWTVYNTGAYLSCLQ